MFCKVVQKKAYSLEAKSYCRVGLTTVAYHLSQKCHQLTSPDLGTCEHWNSIDK